MDGEQQEAVYRHKTDLEVHHNSTPSGAKRLAQRFRIEFLSENEVLEHGLSYSQLVSIYTMCPKKLWLTDGSVL